MIVRNNIYENISITLFLPILLIIGILLTISQAGSSTIIGFVSILSIFIFAIGNYICHFSKNKTVNFSFPINDRHFFRNIANNNISYSLLYLPVSSTLSTPLSRFLCPKEIPNNIQRFTNIFNKIRFKKRQFSTIQNFFTALDNTNTHIKYKQLFRFFCKKQYIYSIKVNTSALNTPFTATNLLVSTYTRNDIVKFTFKNINVA